RDTTPRPPPPRPPGAARRRLAPQSFERTPPPEPAVRDAVERHAPREAQIPHPGLAVAVTGHAQHHLLGHRLHRRREVHLALRDWRLVKARRPSAELVRH